MLQIRSLGVHFDVQMPSLGEELVLSLGILELLFLKTALTAVWVHQTSLNPLEVWVGKQRFLVEIWVTWRPLQVTRSVEGKEVPSLLPGCQCYPLRMYSSSVLEMCVV